MNLLRFQNALECLGEAKRLGNKFVENSIAECRRLQRGAPKASALLTMARAGLPQAAIQNAPAQPQGPVPKAANAPEATASKARSAPVPEAEGGVQIGNLHMAT